MCSSDLAIAVERETRVEAGANSVILLDIADRSAHAFHYVVFWFPATGILFEDDLGYFPEKLPATAGQRLVGHAEMAGDVPGHAFAVGDELLVPHLHDALALPADGGHVAPPRPRGPAGVGDLLERVGELGRASCRERV